MSSFLKKTFQKIPLSSRMYANFEPGNEIDKFGIGGKTTNIHQKIPRRKFLQYLNWTMFQKVNITNLR